MPTLSEIRNIYYVISGQRASKIDPLKAGFSNHSYLINNRHVLRIKKPLKDSYYDARQEAFAIKNVTPLKISESVLFFDERDGTKLSLFLTRTKKIVDIPTDKQLSLVAKTLHKLHRTKIVSGKSFDVFERLRYYKSKCVDFVDSIYERKVVASVERFYNSEPFVLCHNDVVNGNLLFRSNKVFLIDFEYASDNNPLFDLASFLSENNIDDEKTRRLFLKYYFNKRCDEKIYRHILRLIALQDILWYYWAQMHYVASKEMIYKRIAHHKWKAIMKNASSR